MSIETRGWMPSRKLSSPEVQKLAFDRLGRVQELADSPADLAVFRSHIDSDFLDYYDELDPVEQAQMAAVSELDDDTLIAVIESDVDMVTGLHDFKNLIARTAMMTDREKVTDILRQKDLGAQLNTGLDKAA